MDPAVKRLAAQPEELTLDQAAYVLGRGTDFVRHLCSTHKVESRRDCARGHHANHRYLISRASLIAYLIRSTTGDRLILMSAIAQHWPDLVEWARAIAAGARNPAPAIKPARRLPDQTWHPDQLALFDSPPTP